MPDTKTPAEVFPMIDFIDEEMTARGWDWKDLAARTEKPLTPVKILELQLIDAMRPSNGSENGKDIRWSDEDYADLGKIFGTTPVFWQNLDSAYRRQETASDA